MIGDLKPYAEYKESGLPWLGQVPTHWGTRVLKRLCSRSALYGANIPASNYVSAGLRFLRTTDITDDGTLRRGGVFVGQAAAQDYMLADGDLLVSRSGTIGRSLRYRATVHGPCAYAGYLVRFVPAPTVSADYLFHFTKSLAFADFIRVSAVSSTIENVNGDKFANMPLTLPPPDEQAAIVRFLDWANGRLERAIRAKRKVIALLNEQKQAIIHRAVTRGLDPFVPLKPSGIPWLGDIPQHWEVRRAKYLFREVDERSRDGSEELLSVSHLTGVTPRSQKNITMFKAASYAGHKLCRPGDLVVNTMWAWMGALGVSTYTGIISPAYAVYRPRRPDSIVGIYMDGLLRGRPYVSNIICRSTGLRASRLRLYPEEFFRLPIIQPPADEQRRIVERIDEETAELDAAISRLEREIELLREYRTRLVADVVTGKLDVREVAARLPDEAPPGAMEDDADLSDEVEAADEEAAV